MTNKKQIVAVLAVLAVSLSFASMYSEANAQEETPFPSREKTISVTGMATTSVEPDFLTIRFGTEIQEKTAQQALQSNSAMMNEVITSLKKEGITESEISTSSLNIYPVYEHVKGEFSRFDSTELVGYKVSNIITVQTKNTDLAASIIDSGVAAGVNRVDSVYFSLSPERQMQLKDDLLEQAVINAKTKAQKALAPLDHKIIGVKMVSLSEFSVPYPQPVFRDGFVMESMALSAPTPVFSSEQDVTTSAHLVFIIGSN